MDINVAFSKLAKPRVCMWECGNIVVKWVAPPAGGQI